MVRNVGVEDSKGSTREQLAEGMVKGQVVDSRSQKRSDESRGFPGRPPEQVVRHIREMLLQSSSVKPSA